jgi:hypothetical protein
MYVDQLRKREAILLSGGGGQEVSATLSMPDETTKDAVLEGRIATTVFNTAAKAFPEDPAFLASMLSVAFEFDFASGIEDPVRKEIER